MGMLRSSHKDSNNRNAGKNEPETNAIKKYKGIFWNLTEKRNTEMPRTTSLYYVGFFITQCNKHSSLMKRIFVSHILIKMLK